MGRLERRAAVRDFRRKAAGLPLTTYLVRAGTPLRHAMLEDALTFWQVNRAARKPCCIACRTLFADAAALPGAYLFATTPSQPGVASVSVFCDQCWRDLPDDRVEAHAQRVLRRLLPRGAFEPRRGAAP